MWRDSIRNKGVKASINSLDKRRHDDDYNNNNSKDKNKGYITRNFYTKSNIPPDLYEFKIFIGCYM